MRLSERLERVVSFVKPCASAADIGTDHALVPVELVRRGIVKKAIAMDVRPGPLSRAKEQISRAGLSDQIEPRLSDGLAALKPQEAETVIIAGMGGELIIRILTVGRHMWDSVAQWVLSPHSEVFKVRGWLLENGFSIEKEDMVCEDGKYYVLMDVKRAEAETGAETEAETEAGEGTGAEAGLKTESPARDTEFVRLLYGDSLIRERNPVLAQYLKEEEQMLMEREASLRQSAKGSLRAAERLKETETRLKWNREVQDEMQRDH